MEKSHDTFIDLHLGTPGWFRFLAWFLPIGIFAQFLTAGFGLFFNADFLGLHGAIGIALSLPIIGILLCALLVRRFRGFGWWAGVVMLFYLAQVGLAAGGASLLLSLHPVNAALLLTASIILLFKVERRHAQPSSAQLSPTGAA